MKMVLHILAWVVLVCSVVNAVYANFLSGPEMGTEMGVWSLFVVAIAIMITAKTCSCPGCACNSMKSGGCMCGGADCKDCVAKK